MRILVKDVDASYRFYKDLIGLAIDAPAGDGPSDERHVHAQFGSRDDESSFMLTIQAAGRDAPAPARIGFRVDDVDAMHERLTRAGTPVQRAVEDKPWGRSAVYLDPDGNVVSLIERQQPR
jgi:predicted enzyme related to lactoylglutathione lyase